jgi:zinc transport system ATP-binding protein
LLKLILGFLSPSSGTVSVFGKEPRLAQSEIAYVPQQMRFDRSFPISTLELVLGGRLAHLPWYGRFKQEDREKALYALEKVGLADLAPRSFASLSGGQQQRVLIARALASEPKLLLLDEPTASVDPEAEAAILNLLQSMRGSITLMMVTHDLQTAIHYVDRVLVVQHQVIAYTPQEVCEHYALGLYHPPLLNLRSSHD